MGGAGRRARLARRPGAGAARPFRRAGGGRDAGLASLARPRRPARGQRFARVDPALPVGGAGRRRPCRRRARLQPRQAEPVAARLRRLGRALDRRPGRRHLARARLLLAGRGRADRPRDRVAALAPRLAPRAGRGRAPRRGGDAPARGDRRGRARAAGAAPADRHRADPGRRAQEHPRRQGTAEAALQRAGRHQAAAGRPARLGAAAPGDGERRDARDDLAPDREEAEGLRRRGPGRRRLARAGDHPLRDRAGGRREGGAGRQPRQGPGAQPEPGLDPRRRDDSRQDDDGARAAQRQAADDPPLRSARLAGLCRLRLAADDRPRQGHRRPAGGRRPGEDAALPGGGHHRRRQVGRHQRDDPEPALQGRGARRPPDPDRSEDARDERLRGHPAPALPGGHRHEAGRQRAQLGRGRDGAALQADEQARRAQRRRLQQEAGGSRGEGRVASRTPSA